ncbi:MAG: hypothetical protein JO189_24705 [Deltaproteobacteria bacterium]|nr:hypothetical protein [Deltaproteobacteria bacterium]
MISGLSGGLFLFGLAVGLIIADRRNNDAPQNVLTNLKVEFFGDQRIPRELYQHNVATWYALWSPSATISQVDSTTGKEIGRQLIVPKTWSIFLLFAEPARFRQIVLSAAGGDLPPYEIKLSSAKFAIIQISGDVPKGALEINAQS